MDKVEKEKLEILLKHWVEHNTEHAQEFTDWAYKAEGSGQYAVHSDIMQAVQHMNDVNVHLLKALEKLKEG